MGDSLIKKFVLVISIFCLLFSFTANAKKMEIIDTLEPYGEFYVLGENNNEIADILGVSSEELNAVDDSYLAVNKENTKQIRVTASVTDFSNSIGNISNLSNDKISALVPELSGVENAKGEVIDKDGQKFVKIQLRTEDGGGEYILTQYITVAARQSVTLSFYTDMGENTEYIEKTFETFGSPLFNSDTSEEKDNRIQYVILAAAGVFLIICVAVFISIIIDIKKNNKQELSESEEPLD